MDTTFHDVIWTRRIGDCCVRWFEPPAGVDGAFPYVAADDVLALLKPPSSSIARYARAAQDDPEVGGVEVDTEDGRLVIVPHEHVRAVILVGMAMERAPQGTLEEYLAGAESAIYILLAPMKAESREAWLAAFQARHEQAIAGAGA